MNDPLANNITSFFHCALCIEERPDGISPRDWASYDVGFTEVGVQVWCKRHEVNIVHIDFQGQRHPAWTTRRAGA